MKEISSSGDEQIEEDFPIEIYSSYPKDDSISELGIDLKDKVETLEEQAGDKNSHARASMEISSATGDVQLRAPNFLPEEEQKENEKVDLRHQEEEDRRNSEEWMIDFALRKAVEKLDPQRRRKVELLVEAFETVLPTVSSEYSGSSCL